MTSEWEALVVGINRYPQMTTLHDLTVAAKDAEDIAVHLRDYGYQPYRVQCLPQESDQKGEACIHPTGMVTSAELQEALSNLLNPPPPNEPSETALFYFSGHGWRQTVDDKDEVFLATSDVFPQIGEYGLSLSWLGEQLQQSRVKRVIVWLDCCLSGELMAFQPTNKAFCLITATRSYEPGLEIPHEQGLLTTALLDGLNPKNYPDGIVTSHLLKGFIETRMAQTSQRPLMENSQQAILLTTSSPKRRFENTCPYRSLSYFKEKPEDAAVFYGRSALTQQLIGRVKQRHHFVAVLGASGSGKSSLLRAGLLYQLKLGQDIPGSDTWIYLEPFSPQANPLERLKEVIEKGTLHPHHPGRGEQQQVKASLLLPFSHNGEKGLGDEGISSQPVVMVIDQFEEAFTMCNEIQRQEFFNYLIELNQLNPHLYLFIGMRSDFRSRLREYRPLMECINKPYINVEHLNREEIAEAIVKPADWVGLGIEGELKERIINDVEDYPGSLPLLQYTLTELWNEAQKRGEQFLRLSTYTQLGGIEGTLEKRAEHVYQNLSTEEKIVAQRLFLELTQVGDTYDTRRQVYLEDLPNSHHSLAILKEVSNILARADNRLITCEASQSEKTDASPTSNIQIDVVHEALIRHWKRLRDWQDENREAMIVEREIETQAQQWKAEGKPKTMESLLTGVKLAKAEDYLSKYGELGMLDGVAEEYINVSRQQDKTRRRQQRLTIGGVIGVVFLAAIVSAFFGLQSCRLATMVHLREEAANIEILLPWGTATPLIQAIQTTGNSQNSVGTVLSEVYSSLYDSVGDVRERNSFSGHQADVNAVAFSPDGKRIVSGSDDNTLKLWDTSGNLLYTLAGHQADVNAVAFSPDSKRIVSGSDDNTLKLWDTTSGNLLYTLAGHQASVSAVAFSPDGKRIVSGSDDNTLKLWDTSGKLLHTLKGHQADVNAVTFSLDGQRIVSGSDDGTLKLWDTSGKLLHTLEGHEDAVFAVAFSPDSKRIVSGSDDGTLKLWDTFGKLLHTFRGHEDAVFAVVFSPDGKRIVSGSDDNTLKLWDTSGNLLHTLEGHEDAVFAMAFSPDGKRIISGNGNGTFKLWDTSGNLLDTFRGHEDAVFAVAFSPDGKRIISGNGNGTLKLWDTSGNLLDTFRGHEDAVFAVAFSPDGKRIISGSGDGTLKLWDTFGKLLHTFRGHENAVNAVAFSPDGKRIISGSYDNTFKLWRAGNWQNLLQVGCERLRLHPRLASPDNDKAGATCLQYGGWKETEKAEFLVRQGKAIAQETQDINAAIKKFKQAKRLNPDYQLTSLEREAKKLAAPG